MLPQEPRLYWLSARPGRPEMLCVRLSRSDKFCPHASQLLDEVMALLGEDKSSICRQDTFENHGCEIMAQLHMEGMYRSEFISAVGSFRSIRACGLASNLKLRTRAYHLAMATSIILNLLQGPENVRTVFLLRQDAYLSQLVSEARFARAQQPPRVPTAEEIFSFQVELGDVQLNPLRWHSIDAPQRGRGEMPQHFL